MKGIGSVMKDDSIIYFITNFIVYIALYAFCLAVLMDIFKNFLIRFVLIVVFLPICGYLEEKIFSRYINELVEKILNIR